MSTHTALPLVPPHDLLAEQAILGAALLDSEAATLVADAGSTIFYLEKHRLIAAAMTCLVCKREPVDVVTVRGELERAGALDLAGGIATLALLADAGSTAAYADAYLATVKERAVRRELLRLGMELAASAGDAAGPSTESLLSEMLRRLIAIDSVGGDGIVTPDRFATEIGTASEAKGLSTGISLIDDLCDGLRPGNLVVIAGRPGMGKTALALQIAHRLSIDEGLPVLFCSLEMTRAEIGLRLLSLETGIRSQLLRSLLADPRRVAAAQDAIRRSGFYIVDEAAPTLSTVQAHMRRGRGRHGAVAAVVDHIGKIQAGRRESRYLEVGEVAQGLKASAKQLGIPVIALAQLNRLVERRNSPRPQLSDLRDSGNIEEEADAVVFLWTGEERPEGKDPLPVNLYLAKNRHGETGEGAYLFRKSLGRISGQSSRTDPDR